MCVKLRVCSSSSLQTLLQSGMAPESPGPESGIGSCRPCLCSNAFVKLDCDELRDGKEGVGSLAGIFSV